MAEKINSPDDQTKLQIPEPEPSGFVKTLNNMGFMTSTLDPFSAEFVEFSKMAPGPVLDIGAAYGVASLAALKQGAKVIANDVDDRHLSILFDRTEPGSRANLSLACGSFPEELDFAPASLGAVLICRVFHFFEPAKLEASIKKVAEWIAPGGKVFVVSETPYVSTLKPFIRIYEERRARGELWPGLVNIAEINPELLAALPPMMHLLDEQVLSRLFREAGLEVFLAPYIVSLDFSPQFMREIPVFSPLKESLKCSSPRQDLDPIRSFTRGLFARNNPLECLGKLCSERSEVATIVHGDLG